MRQYQPNLRVLRRMCVFGFSALCFQFLNAVNHRQAPIQHQALEDVHRLLQLLAHCRDHRREDIHDARWSQPRLAIYGANTKGYEADRRSRHWYVTHFSHIIQITLTVIQQVCSVICCGRILTKTSLGGLKTTEECLSPLDPMSCLGSCRSTTWT